MACRDMGELRPEFRELLEKALAEAERQGLEVKVIETYRSQKRQNELYAKGRTKPGSIRTKTRHSKHTERIAADVVPLVDGNIAWNRHDLFVRWGHCAESVGLKWGGRFKNFFDGAHVEMED